MKTGRNVHVPKPTQMKQNYRRYIDTLDYQPTVDERLNFNQTSQSGEELSDVETSKKEKILYGLLFLKEGYNKADNQQT